jgi:hypothetical protein
MSSTILRSCLSYKILVLLVSATFDLGSEVFSQLLVDVDAELAAAECDCNV